MNLIFSLVLVVGAFATCGLVVYLAGYIEGFKDGKK